MWYAISFISGGIIGGIVSMILFAIFSINKDKD